MDEIGAIILAAGEGTRLNEGNPSPKPKVLYEVAGKPMLSYSLDILKALGIVDVVIVVGYLGEQVKKFAGNNYHYAIQEKAVGTGDAVRVGLEKLGPRVKKVLVLYGADIYQKAVIEKLISLHNQEKTVLGFLTAQREDPVGLGRIVRDNEGNLVAIVEEKLASAEQKLITEVNDGGYIFDRLWLETAIKQLQLTSAAEYFLTDLAELAVKQNEKITIYKIEGEGWFGVDTQEQIERTSQKIKEEWKL